LFPRTLAHQPLVSPPPTPNTNTKQNLFMAIMRIVGIAQRM
jgi:hypothetical protein